MRRRRDSGERLLILEDATVVQHEGGRGGDGEGAICTKGADKFRRTFPVSPLCSLLSHMLSQPWDLRGNLAELCDPD